MLTLVDTRRGDRLPLGWCTGRLVRLCASLPYVEAELSILGLRIAVVTDLLRRVLEELHGQQAMVAVAAPGMTETTLREQLEPLWVQAPAGVIDSPHAGAEVLGGPIDVLVTSAGDTSAGTGILRLTVGAMTGPCDGDGSVLRMLVLLRHYAQSAHLDEKDLDAADETLYRWRELIARWGAQASAPMPQEVVSRAYAACDDDLDIPAVLALLSSLEHDDDIREGAKFETFAHLDRILGLDLARFLGH
ncbi:hypothetical protein ACFHYQ_01185 [Sphaerimonospora cavernae]|uniref:Cysteinyl-tRNA synthetase n=1 Tax=Sphaerimonospora cavernae TaxID=1740611 RepID=A0ABV6TXH2_9ACTN